MPICQRTDSSDMHGSTGHPNLVPGNLGQEANVPVITWEDYVSEEVCVSEKDCVGTGWT